MQRSLIQPLRLFVVSTLFVTPFVAFFVFNSLFFPFITSKAFVFRILVEVMFGAWLVLMFLDVAYRPKRSWILYTFGGFLVIIALADMFGANFYRSFWSNYERMDGLVTLLHLFAYFLMLGTVLSTQKLWNYFLNTSIGASVIMCVFYGLPQLLGTAKIHQSSDRLDAALGNATYFAVYLLIHIFIALFLLTRSKTITPRMLYGAVIVLETFLLFFTQTRGALLGLIGGLFLTACIIAIWGKTEPTLRKISFGLLVGIVIIVLTFFVVRDSDVVQRNATLKRLSEISLSEEFLRGQGRYYVWPMAIKGFAERPILGWGQENFNYVFNKNYDPHMWSQEQWFDRTHNVVLDWLVAGGILGLGSYLAIFVALLYYIWRGRGTDFSLSQKAVLTGLLAAYFFQNMFVFDNLISYMLFVTVIAYIYTTQTRVDAGPLWSRSPSHPFSGHIALSVAVILVVVGVYCVNVKPLQANKALLKAAAPQSGSTYHTHSLEFFKEAISYNTFGTGEAREHLVFLAQKSATASENELSQDVLRSIFETARGEMRVAIEQSPYPDARQYLFMASLLGRYGVLEEASEYIDKAIELSPRKQSILFEKINIEIAQGNIESAFDVAREAFELDPTHTEARIRYMVLAVQIGMTDLAEELALGVDENQIIFDERILSIYAQAEQYEKVIDILKKRVEIDPQNAQYILSLAAAYLQAGNRALSIETIRQFIALDPSQYEAEGEYYIQEIQAGRNP